MHVLNLLIDTTEYQKQIINKRFNIYVRLYNIAVKHAKKLITRLERNTDYKTYLNEYKQLLQKSQLTKSEKHRKAELNKLLNDIRFDIGLTKFGLQSYLKLERNTRLTCHPSKFNPYLTEFSNLLKNICLKTVSVSVLKSSLMLIPLVEPVILTELSSIKKQCLLSG